MNTDFCLKCSNHMAVRTNDPNFKFIGCTYPPYRGKWVVQIETCPAGKIETDEEVEDFVF